MACFCQSMTTSQTHYSAQKLWFLELNWVGVDRLHDYLYGTKFEVRRDNRPLTYMVYLLRYMQQVTVGSLSCPIIILASNTDQVYITLILMSYLVQMHGVFMWTNINGLLKPLHERILSVRQLRGSATTVFLLFSTLWGGLFNKAKFDSLTVLQSGQEWT